MILFLSACVGLTWILKYATILDPIRQPIKSWHPKLNELFNCSLFLGVWSGVIVGLFSWHYCYYEYEALLFPLSSAAFSWFFDSLISIIHLQKIKDEVELNLD